MDDTSCNNCGTPITSEPPNGDPVQRKPCPQCGSMARRFSLHAEPGNLSLGGINAGLVVVPYSERVLRKSCVFFTSDGSNNRQGNSDRSLVAHGLPP